MRDKVIDAAKGLGILLVILGHTDERPRLLMKWIYTFHMPLFFFISGYLFNQERYKGYTFSQFFARKSKSYLIPYFSITFTFYFLYLANELITTSTLRITELSAPLVKYLIGIVFYSRGTAEWLPLTSPLWFLTALFLTELLFFALFKWSRSQQELALGVLTLAVLGYITSLKLSTKLPWNFDTALTSVLFFYIGYLVQGKKALDLLTKNKILLTLSILLSLLSVGLNAMIVSFDDNRYGDGLLMYAGAFGGIVLALYLSRILVQSKVLNYFGRHTLLIMGFNFAVLKLAKEILVRVGFSGWLQSFLLQIFLMVVLLEGLKRIPPLYRVYTGKGRGRS